MSVSNSESERKERLESRKTASMNLKGSRAIIGLLTAVIGLITAVVVAISVLGNHGVSTNIVIMPQASPTPVLATQPTSHTYSETAGGVAHTWTDYTNGGGIQGPSIAVNETIQVTCKISGLKVPDGDTWWYRIASSPWNNNYYVSADAFYNGDRPEGSLIGTPKVDPKVVTC